MSDEKDLNEQRNQKIMDRIEREGLEGILPDRIEELVRRLYVIHELRWQVGSMYPGANQEENDKYFDANEFLNETEKRAWEYGKGQREDL